MSIDFKKHFKTAQSIDLSDTTKPFNVRSGTAVAATQAKFRLLTGVLGRWRDFVGQGRGGGVVRVFHVGVGATARTRKSIGSKKAALVWDHSR